MKIFFYKKFAYFSEYCRFHFNLSLMNLKHFIYYLSILALLCLLNACSSHNSTLNNNKNEELNDKTTYVKIPDSDSIRADWPKENTVVFHWTSEPDNLHPTNGTSANKKLIENYTQKYLISSDIKNLKLRPDLVKSLPKISNDELQFTYELREEPRWDNGDPLTIEDVIFSLKAVKCPLINNPHVKPFVENLKDIVVDRSIPEYSLL